MLEFASLPFIPCQHRTPRQSTDLIVIHTNEGPEGVNSAEDLAHYLETTKNGAGYNLIIDENSAVLTAGLHEAVWGAGGVNSRAFHICDTGYAAQDITQWDDEESRATIANTRDLLRQVAPLLDVPIRRVTDTRPGAPKGVCGHGDVSRYHPESMGHTDPGPNYPWARVLGTPESAPTPEVSHLIKQFISVDGTNVYFWDGSHRPMLINGASRDLRLNLEIVKRQPEGRQVARISQAEFDQCVAEAASVGL